MAIDAVVIKDDIADAPRVADLSWVHWASLNLASMEFCPALQTCTNNNLTGLGWHGPSALSISSRQGTELSVFLAHQHLLFSDGSSCVFGFSPHLPFFSFLPSIFFFLSFFFFFTLAYGNSQTSGWIRAAAAGLHHSHSNWRSEPHPRHTLQLMAKDQRTRDWTHILMGTSWVCYHWATTRTPSLVFFILLFLLSYMCFIFLSLC